MSDNVKRFTANKRYTHFGELLKDASVSFKEEASGIIVVFSPEGWQCLPVASLEQIAFASIKLGEVVTQGSDAIYLAETEE